MLVTLLLYMVSDGNRRGYAHLLEGFWDEASSFGISLPTELPVSAAAFCSARSKIAPRLIRDLLHQAANTYDTEFGKDHRWFGRRVFGIDGSKFNLNRSDELARTFGTPQGGYSPQVLVSTLFDLVAKVPHDVLVAPFASSEREQMVGHLDRLTPGDILVLDRGYPSFESLCMLQDAGIDFVIRVPIRATFKAIDGFLQQGGDDHRVRIDPPEGSPLRNRDPLELRAVRVVGAKDEPTLLLTSLRRSEFCKNKIADLYRRRWEIEEYYKLTKSDYLSQGQFHAKSAIGIEQEIVALALFVAITRYFMAASANIHELEYDDLSTKGAILALAAYATRILLDCQPNRVASALASLLIRISRAREPRRPGRHAPRRSFKPVRKWGPLGRRGG